MLRAAPKLICYDRACKLHTYCARRQPVHFAETVFRVDMTHYPNHVGCASTYNAAAFRKLDMPASLAAVPYFNTQIVEQTNAALAMVTKSVSFMTQANFVKYVRTFLARRNLRKRGVLLL